MPYLNNGFHPSMYLTFVVEEVFLSVNKVAVDAVCFGGNSTLSHLLKKKDLSPKNLSKRCSQHIYHLDSFEYFKPQKVCSLSVANVFFFSVVE